MNQSVLCLGLMALLAGPPAKAGGCLSCCETPVDQRGPMEGLLVMGRIQDGTATLAPAFPLPWLADQPELGEYSLVFRDGSGGMLNKIHFTPKPSAAAPGLEQGTSFHLVVPYTSAMRESMVAIELYHGETRLGELRATSHHARVAPLGKEPAARVIRRGVVRLNWDAATHPGVMVKDGETGHDLGRAEGGTIDMDTYAEELELNLSDGLRSLHRRIKVSASGPML